jgi:hypothetical protein
MRLLAALTWFLAANGASFGALPPLYQNAAEIKAILNDPKLGDYLESGELILEIKKSDSGWLIITNHHELPVKISYHQAEMPGPVPFSISFSD